jgi:hypothetical protein
MKRVQVNTPEVQYPRPTTAGITVKIREAGTVGTSWISSAVGPPESDSRPVSNSREDRFSRDTSNSSRN